MFVLIRMLPQQYNYFALPQIIKGIQHSRKHACGFILTLEQGPGGPAAKAPSSVKCYSHISRDFYIFKKRQNNRNTVTPALEWHLGR